MNDGQSWYTCNDDRIDLGVKDVIQVLKMIFWYLLADTWKSDWVEEPRQCEIPNTIHSGEVYWHLLKLRMLIMIKMIMI